MSRVRQLVAAAAPGDAVTGQALAWAAALSEWGHQVEIIAEHVHPALGGRVRRLADVRDLGADPLILHYSIWSAVVPAALQASGPLAVCYHNVTPGALLRDANPALAEACDRARAALPTLRDRVTALVADSTFNAEELRAAGCGEAAVVPLLLGRTTPPPARPAGRPPAIVSVGRIVPNKRLEDVLRVTALLQRNGMPDATLTLAGGAGGFERYRDALVRLAERLGVRGVRFTGWVPDAELRAIYGRADAYLAMSEHEGFCIPLVEAMGHGVPVVARDAGAVRETVGGAGLVVDHDLPLAAEAVAEVVGSAATREGLARAAARRLAELDPGIVGARLRRALAPVLGRGGT